MFVHVVVTAAAKKERVTKVDESRYTIEVREPASRNLANQRVRELIAREFGATARSARIVAGHRSPKKVISLDI